jgi:hypothetical protein
MRVKQSGNRSDTTGPDRLKRLNGRSSPVFYRSRKIVEIHRFSRDKMPAEQVLLLLSNRKALLCQNIILYTFWVLLVTTLYY